MIRISKINSKEVKVGEDKTLIVSNVYCARNMVCLDFNGTKLEVLASDLERAIKNSINID